MPKFILSINLGNDGMKTGAPKYTPLYTRAHAAEYVWQKSKSIRDWYLVEHKFDLDNYSRSEYNTYGRNAPGEIVSLIIDEGIDDGLICEEDGNYRVI